MGGLGFLECTVIWPQHSLHVLCCNVGALECCRRAQDLKQSYSAGSVRYLRFRAPSDGLIRFDYLRHDRFRNGMY